MLSASLIQLEYVSKQWKSTFSYLIGHSFATFGTYALVGSLWYWWSCISYALVQAKGRPENCFAGGGGGWHGRPAKEGGEVPEMGFRAGPFVLCKDGYSRKGAGTQILARKITSKRGC